MRQTIEVRIGEQSVHYHVRETRAPKNYDGFGTFTIADFGTYGRMVLIRAEHLQWQEARYASGVFACELPETFDDQVVRHIEDELWKRIQKKDENQ